MVFEWYLCWLMDVLLTNIFRFVPLLIYSLSHLKTLELPKTKLNEALLVVPVTATATKVRKKFNLNEPQRRDSQKNHPIQILPC